MIETFRTLTFAHAINGLVWRAEHSWSMDVGVPMYFGFTVPARKIVALGREYNTDSTSLQVDLYEASWSGGDPTKTINRDLESRNDPPPMQFFHAVTPGALTDRITGFEIATQGSIRIGRQGEVEPFVHDALTSYVLVITNNAAGVKDYSFTVDYRLIQPGEAK